MTGRDVALAIATPHDSVDSKRMARYGGLPPTADAGELVGRLHGGGVVAGAGVRGVLSHGTALDLYGLSDVNPAKIDVTLPRAHRIRRAVPTVYRIHHEDLPDEDVTTFEGIPIVTPARAIRQAAAAHLGPALIGQAIDHPERAMAG